ncbi:hypothetical protein RUM43_006781 [Polyplax serrata]|uniref:Uncharacterized protein n=1 Tax=Polyplax serrata TaxID=468196 RepID=A0AAN8P0Y6_POLSC
MEEPWKEDRKRLDVIRTKKKSRNDDELEALLTSFECVGFNNDPYTGFNQLRRELSSPVYNQPMSPTTTTTAMYNFVYLIDAKDLSVHRRVLQYKYEGNRSGNNEDD